MTLARLFFAFVIGAGVFAAVLMALNGWRLKGK